jgi:hypothetical protein
LAPQPPPPVCKLSLFLNLPVWLRSSLPVGRDGDRERGEEPNHI